MSGRTLVIGLDGATFTLLDSLVAEGVMPSVGRLMSEGVRAHLRTVTPALAAPAWASLLTGCPPGRHGVFDRVRAESLETRHCRFVDSRDVACGTIWTIAHQDGLRVTALNFPLAFPTPDMSGLIIPAWVPWPQLRDASHPPDLFERLESLPGFNPRDLATEVEIDVRGAQGGALAEHELLIERQIRRDERWLEVLGHLAGDGPTELSAVLFDGIGKVQDQRGRLLDPAAGDSREGHRKEGRRDIWRAYFRRLDRLVARLCESMGEKATVFVVSVPGSRPAGKAFALNSWLEERGYPAWAVPTSNGIHVVVSRSGSPGLPADQYHAFREKLIQELLDLRDPVSSQPQLARIWTREEAFAGPLMALAPDLSLEWGNGEPPSADRSHGVFIAHGPGVRRGATLLQTSMLDVAPTLLHSLGVAIPAEIEGRVREEIFEPETPGKRPMQTSRADSSPFVPAPAPPAPVLRVEEERMIADRLRELGYIE